MAGFSQGLTRQLSRQAQSALALNIMYPLIWWVDVVAKCAPTSTKKVVTCQNTRMFHLKNYAEFFPEKYFFLKMSFILKYFPILSKENNLRLCHVTGICRIRTTHSQQKSIFIHQVVSDGLGRVGASQGH